MGMLLRRHYKDEQNEPVKKDETPKKRVRKTKETAEDAE